MLTVLAVLVFKPQTFRRLDLRLVELWSKSGL